jgi:pyroglutamyl-peptidase
MRILLTGFEPFNDERNSSQVLAESLRDDPPESMPGFANLVEVRIMPVDTEGIAEVLAATLAEVVPDVCLLMGQATGRNRISVERLAVNIREFESPDTAGNVARGSSIRPDGPVGYRSTLPDQEALVSRLKQAGIPAEVSNHAGTHLCNQILYLALEWAEKNRPDMRVGFVHIPLLPEQTEGRFSRYAFMPLDMSRQAMTIVISSLVAGHGGPFPVNV